MKLLDISEVCEKVGYGRSWILNREREGTFPASRKTGRKNLWLESDIDKWIEALPVKTNEGVS